MAAVLFASCEVIKEEDRLIPVPVDVSSGRKHVLLEFTGFRCVNCPTAAAQAQSLLSLYGEGLIVISLHPASNPFTQGLYDYTCPAADTIYRYLGGNASTPFPTGNIDLVKSNGNCFFDPAEWGGLLRTAMNDSTAPSLSIEAKIDTLTRQMDATATIIAGEGVEMRLAVWVTEDSIRGVQAMPDGSVNTQYIHRHMLRTHAFDSPWGEKIQMSKKVAQQKVHFTLPEGCNPGQCRVIALLLDNNDKHILQAYETNPDDGSGSLP